MIKRKTTNEEQSVLEAATRIVEATASPWHDPRTHRQLVNLLTEFAIYTNANASIMVDISYECDSEWWKAWNRLCQSNNVTYVVVSLAGPAGGNPVIEMTGEPGDIETVVAHGKWNGDFEMAKEDLEDLSRF